MPLKKWSLKPRQDETELVIWVRGAHSEITEHGELNVRLQEFATELVQRGLIAKVQFLQAMEFSHSPAVNVGSTSIYRKLANWKLLASTLNAIVATKQRIIDSTQQVLGWSKQLGLLQQALGTLVTLARDAANKPRELREAIRRRNNHLRNLLATSFDAVVITDREHRFVHANLRALDLFGISERNIRMFTMDAFLPHRQIAELDEAGAPFVHRRELQGQCEIKRLDGSLLFARYTFISNAAPRQHLYRFQGLAPQRILPVSYGQRHWVTS
jgi:PAS domain-containing protein